MTQTKDRCRKVTARRKAQVKPWCRKITCSLTETGWALATNIAAGLVTASVHQRGLH